METKEIRIVLNEMTFTNLCKSGFFTHNSPEFGKSDIHIYKQHIEAAKKQLERTLFSTPELQIKKSIASIEDLVWEDIVVVGYESHPNDLGAKMVA